jgi:hypothetical protein
MPFGPHPCDDPNHGKKVGPVDMVVLAIRTVIQIHVHPWMGTSQRQRCWEAMTLASPWWCQLVFSMRCCDVWEDAFSVHGGTRGSCCKLFVYSAHGAENISEQAKEGTLYMRFFFLPFLSEGYTVV